MNPFDTQCQNLHITILPPIWMSERLIKMGEREDCVFNVGCPSIDALLEVEDDPNCLSDNLVKPFFSTSTSVTTEYSQSRFQMLQTIEAPKNLKEPHW